MSEAKLSDLRIVLASPIPSPGCDSLLSSLVSTWRSESVQVNLLALDHRQSDEELADLFRDELADSGQCNSPLIIGGYSLGARLALSIAPEFSPIGILAYSFPAHRHGQPQKQHGLAALTGLNTPTLIVQGTRDSHGTQSEFQTYKSLPRCLSMHWLNGANHQWQSKQSSPIGLEQHIESASTASLQFLTKLVSSAQ